VNGFRGAGRSQVIINAGRNGFHSSVPIDGRTCSKRAGHVHVDGAVAQLLNGFQHSRVRSRLAAVLANSVVLFTARTVVVLQTSYASTAFLHTHLFRPGTPDALARANDWAWRWRWRQYLCPQAAYNVDVGFWLWNPSFSMSRALVNTLFIHIAQSGNSALDTGKP